MIPVLELKNIHKSYRRNNSAVQAVKGVGFKIFPGECLGLVGESGCGKSTLAKLITASEPADRGEIYIKGNKILKADKNSYKRICETVQMVYQVPVTSFNPRQRLGNSIMEGMINRGISKKEARDRAGEYLEICGLTKEYAERYPHQVSGGECQRASFARAIAVNPSLLICDEATSALDVTVQAQIIKLIGKLKTENNTAYLFISHDIAVVQEICDRMIIMHQGQIVEEGKPDEIISNPKNECTKILIDSCL
jgi:peptide/nickel transport system ATP-binding protein